MKINTLDKITAAKVTALLSAAVVTASAMSGVTAYAEELPDAYNAAELAEEVLTPAVADPTKFDFFGTCVTTHDEQGSPDPQIINNGDGTYNIIMYVGQSVAFPVNNPWADLGIDEWGQNRGWVSFITDAASEYVSNGYAGGFDINDWDNLLIEADKECAVVVDIGVISTRDVQVGNTVTVGLFVLSAVPGAQEPTLTQDEIKSIKASEHDKLWNEQHQDWVATRGGSF